MDKNGFSEELFDLRTKVNKEILQILRKNSNEMTIEELVYRLKVNEVLKEARKKLDLIQELLLKEIEVESR